MNCWGRTDLCSSTREDAFCLSRTDLLLKQNKCFRLKQDRSLLLKQDRCPVSAADICLLPKNQFGRPRSGGIWPSDSKSRVQNGRRRGSFCGTCYMNACRLNYNQTWPVQLPTAELLRPKSRSRVASKIPKRLPEVKK